MNHLALITAFALPGALASAAMVDFDGAPTAPLPYSEAGLTFSSLPGSNLVVVVGGDDGYLVGGTNTIPIHVRVTGEQPFDLLSLDIESIFRTWRIEASSGAVFSPTGRGTIDFTSMSGWTGLTSFDLIHDPGEANGNIRVDNIVFTPVPEPATALLALPALALATRPRRSGNR